MSGELQQKLPVISATDHSLGAGTADFGDLPAKESEVVLSVLCITYNHAAFLAQAIDSFLNQVTTFHFEIVIGEDFSSDSSRSIAEEYAARSPGRVRLLTSESNLGMHRNFRRTYEACRGRYIAICEGDDYWTDTHKLQAQVDFLESNPEYVLAYHDAFCFNSSGVVKASQLGARFQRDATQNELCAGRPISTLTCCFRKVLGDLPLELDQAPVLDLCIWSLLGVHGKGKYLGNIAPAAYRMHEGGAFSPLDQQSRNLQTAQSYTVLARIHQKDGRSNVAMRLQLNATLLLCGSMAMPMKIRLAFNLLDGAFGNPLYRLKQSVLSLKRLCARGGE